MSGCSSSYTAGPTHQLSGAGPRHHRQGGRTTMKKLPNSVKARAFRGAITASSLIALAIAAGAGRKFS